MTKFEIATYQTVILNYFKEARIFDSFYKQFGILIHDDDVFLSISNYNNQTDRQKIGLLRRDEYQPDKLVFHPIWSDMLIHNYLVSMPDIYARTYIISDYVKRNLEIINTRMVSQHIEYLFYLNEKDIYPSCELNVNLSDRFSFKMVCSSNESDTMEAVDILFKDRYYKAVVDKKFTDMNDNEKQLVSMYYQ